MLLNKNKTKQKNHGISSDNLCDHQPDIPFGYISHVQLGNSPETRFRKRAGDWMNLPSVSVWIGQSDFFTAVTPSVAPPTGPVTPGWKRFRFGWFFTMDLRDFRRPAGCDRLWHENSRWSLCCFPVFLKTVLLISSAIDLKLWALLW